MSTKIAKCLLLIGVIIIFIFIIRLLYDGYTIFGVIHDYSTTGQVGDFIGGVVGTVFALAGTLFIYATFVEQRKFNKIQKVIADDEQFKSTFFNLLQVQRSIFEELSGNFSYLVNKETEYTSKDQHGSAFFKHARKQLQMIFESLENGYLSGDDEGLFLEILYKIDKLPDGSTMLPKEFEDEKSKLYTQLKIIFINKIYKISKEKHEKYKSTKEEKEKIKLLYTIFLNKYEKTAHSFNHLYHLLNFIKTEDENKEKNYKQYAKFIPAQMSTEILVLLYYHSFYQTNLQELIIYYGLLENLDAKELISRNHSFAKLGLKFSHDESQLSPS